MIYINFIMVVIIAYSWHLSRWLLFQSLNVLPKLNNTLKCRCTLIFGITKCQNIPIKNYLFSYWSKNYIWCYKDKTVKTFTVWFINMKLVVNYFHLHLKPDCVCMCVFMHSHRQIENIILQGYLFVKIIV